MRTVDFIDDEGIQRRVLLPDDTAASVDEGIPRSLRVDELYSTASLAFRVRLVQELWNRGLVEPCDFLRPEAPELIRSALLAAVKMDTFDILTFAKEGCTK